jgi:hypothetical protein
LVSFSFQRKSCSVSLGYFLMISVDLSCFQYQISIADNNQMVADSAFTVYEHVDDSYPVDCPTRILERQNVLQTSQVLFRRICVSLANFAFQGF